MSNPLASAAGMETLFLRPLRGWRAWTFYLVAVSLFVPAYFYLGNELVRQTNLDMMASDQAANIWLARESTGDFFPLRSSYIQPLWPWVSTFVMDADDQTYFVRGKWLNLALGCSVSVLIFILGAACVAPVPGYMMGWVAGFAVFLQRGHFFHPEPLLYAFYAGAVALMVLSLRANRWWYYLGWGACLGVACLAKASVTPLLAVYAGATLVLLLARRGWLPAWLVGGEAHGKQWTLGRHIVRSLAGVAVFAAVIAPNAAFKLRVHDDAFFSPTKYWMWCDDWDTEAYPLHQRIWTAQARAEFPPGELPTMGNYLRKRGWGHAAARLADGTRLTIESFLLPGRSLVPAAFVFSQKGNTDRGEPGRVWRFVMPARGLYIAMLALVAGLIFIGRCRRDGLPLYRTPCGLASCAYVVAMALLFTLAFGWYAVIGRGERFGLMLYIPLLVAATSAGWLMARASSRRLPRIVFAAGICIVLAHAIIQIFRLLLLPQFSRNFW